ncbi:phage transposase [Aquitalea magnusonii]|uniref:Phage transposase n=1 Tax=Aquitalea magnusonii TaxID=332411 RepID=A0A3G9GCY7_9NEIS|nr:Mu transposase C-terminal domain-containing protein [Aquitalea magnusonii]BBF85730.1 phage transposase [Aquitalea magnusonii]
MTQAELKTHYSAAELAEMKLPSLPGTIQGIGIRAKTEQWESKKRQGRGGGYEYALSSLPDAAVRAIKDRLVTSMIAAPAVSVPVLPMKAQQMELALTSRQQTVEGARKGVLVAIERLMAGCGVTREAAIHTMLTQAKAGTLDPHLERMLRAAHDGRGRKGDSPYPSVRSIKGWRALEKQGQLAPKTAVSAVLEIPAWAKSFLDYWQVPSKPSVSHAYEQFARDWTDSPEMLPSIHQVRRFIGKLGTVSRETGRIGPREMKNIKPFVRRDISDLLPNDVWTADGHTFDAEVQHPLHGRPFRPEITAIIDVATRRIIGWSVGLAESGLAVLDAITHAVTREGVMAIFYVDNGSGYKNDMLRNESTGVMGRLGADMRFARPYNSQAKGAVERLHQSVFVRAARELQSYIGADMDREAKLSQFKLTRKAIKDGGSVNLISWPNFIAFINQRIADYNARPHRGLNGISPDMKLAEFVAMGWEPTRLQPGEEAYLFRPQVERTISRCEISLFGNRYFSRTLEEFHGERLRIGYDVNDASRVWVYADDGRLICTAEWNANVRSFFPVSVIEQAREKRAAGRANRLQVHLEEVQAERRGQPVIEAQQEIVIPGLISGTREQLAEAAALARAKRQPQTAETPSLRVIDVEPTPAPSNVLSLPDTPDARYRYFCTLRDRHQRGEPLGERELDWLLNKYVRTNEYRTLSQR